MNFIQGRIHIGADETLLLRLPGLAGKDVEYTIGISASVENGPGTGTTTPVNGQTMTREAWHTFVDSLQGAIDDPTFARPPQGEYEKRESME